MPKSKFELDQQTLENASNFMDSVYRIGSWKDDSAPATSVPKHGAQAMARIVLQQIESQGKKESSTNLRLFSPTDDPTLETLQEHALAYLIGGALALGMAGENVKTLAPALLRSATAIDPKSLLLRQNLLRDRPYAPPLPVLPSWTEKFTDIAKRHCFAGVISAVHALGQWASTGTTSDANGITGLSATAVCGGDRLSIFGSGFGGTRPQNTRVYVPARKGGCVEAAIKHWGDKEIIVQLPMDVGAGCVGFVHFDNIGNYAEPQQVTGELTACIGAIAQQWTRGFGKVNSALVRCPPCLDAGLNRLHMAGAPIIQRFNFSPPYLDPTGSTTLFWAVDPGSQVLRIEQISGAAPALRLPKKIPNTGSTTLSISQGISRLSLPALFRITASNACGTSTADVELKPREFQLSVLRMEVVQSIQKADNSLRLVANKRTAVRVFVDSGIRDGFDSGIGRNRLAGVRGTLHAINLDDGTVTDCGASWMPTCIAGPSHDRNKLNESLNFEVPLSACHGHVRFQAHVEFPARLGFGVRSSASGQVDTTFFPRNREVLVPFFIEDASVSSTIPSLPNLMRCLNGPRDSQPFAEVGFTLFPSTIITLTAAESLSIEANWNTLLNRLSTMTLMFGAVPTVGVRIGVVPISAQNAIGGLAIVRNPISNPACLVTADLGGVCTHEFGHVYGLRHVNCGNPDGPFDARLPLTISEPGLSIRRKLIFPIGTHEAMSQCFDQWPSAEHWEFLFDHSPA